MGPTRRCTYFLLANGCVTRFTRLGSSPSQKPLVAGGGIGSRPLVDAGAVWSDVELDCCANPGRARATDKKRIRNIGCFIFDLLPSDTSGDFRRMDIRHSTVDCARSGPKLQVLHQYRMRFLRQQCCMCAELFIPAANSLTSWR